MLTLYALRHATTDWNARGLMQGRRDIELSSRGRAEVRGWRLPPAVPPDFRCLSSPLRRAMQTATLLCRRSPAIEPALIEMDWGRWEGSTIDELRDTDPAAYDANARRGLDFRPLGGESPREVLARVQAWLDRIRHSSGTVVAVTHNGVLRALLTAATGWDMTGKPPLRLQPASAHHFLVASDGRLVLVQANLPLASPPL